MAAASGKGFSGWRQGLGLISMGLALGLAAAPQAVAAPAKKAAVKAAKAAPAKAAPAKAAAVKTAQAAKTSAGKAPPAKASARAAAKNGPAAKTAVASKAAAPGKARVAVQLARQQPVAVAKAGKRTERAGRATPRQQLAASRFALARPVSARAGLRADHRASAPQLRLSMGQMAGLRATGDPLSLSSSVALVMDQDSHEILLRKNENAVLPIASLTKLMTGLIISDARLPLDEMITITAEDVDTAKGSSSRLPVGATLTRGELMHLALMSSENRAAHALGRTFPGGLHRFVSLMNARAIMLGMKDTHYVEPTGLSSANRSSAQDLATLVAVAGKDPLLRQFSTSQGYEVALGDRIVQYSNTNRLVHDPDWQISLQKTGYIAEAGRCLVMQTYVAGRKLIMVFLDSSGKQSRLADAERVRRWVELERASRTVAGNHYTS